MNEYDEAESTATIGAIRDDKGRFAPGNAGRPKGSRNRLREEFLAALHADFEQHGAAVIQSVRETKPDVYLKVVASILPAQIDVKVDPLEEMSDADLDRYIRQLAAAVARLEQLEGTETETLTLPH